MRCHKCGQESEVTDKIGFRDECPHCGADLHVCLGCFFYAKGTYNECREPQADRVVDKERANFCEYFQASAGGKATVTNPADEAKRKLREMFKVK